MRNNGDGCFLVIACFFLLIFVAMIFHSMNSNSNKKQIPKVSTHGSGLCIDYYDRASDGSLCGNRAANRR